MNRQDTENSKLKLLQEICLKQNIPFVSYRLPLETESITLVQHHSLPEKLSSLNNIENSIGFIVSPFVQNEHYGTYFLKPDCVFFSNEIDDIYLNKLSGNNRFITEQKILDHTISTTHPAEFIGNVNKAKFAMMNGRFNKVVLSKVRVEELDEQFSAADFYGKLCTKYPHAFVYIMQIPEVGCWMGATPEPLLMLENDKVNTVSLAGTQISTGADIDSYNWQPKEIQEQGIVTCYVEKLLQSLYIENVSKKGPENYQAGNLIHLKTAFEFPVTELKNRFSEFLNALHPTPSVGGLPKEEAISFIHANETHNRAYYTGFLGPLNINKKSSIFVNLRCLQLFDKQFVLYSGAGITSSSVAEHEWEETDHKMRTMLNVMNKY